MKTISNQRAEKIARNINAMDVYYQYIDQHSKWKFWNDLNKKLRDILNTLNEADKEAVKVLCNEDKAKYFGLA